MKSWSQEKKLEYLKKNQEKNSHLKSFRIELPVQEKKKIEENIVKFNCPF